jgi:hypothetical protein
MAYNSMHRPRNAARDELTCHAYLGRMLGASARYMVGSPVEAGREFIPGFKDLDMRGLRPFDADASEALTEAERDRRLGQTGSYNEEFGII